MKLSAPSMLPLRLYTARAGQGHSGTDAGDMDIAVAALRRGCRAVHARLAAARTRNHATTR